MKERDTHAREEEEGIYLSGRWSFSFERRSYQNMKMKKRRKRRRKGEAEKEVWRGGGLDRWLDGKA